MCSAIIYGGNSVASRKCRRGDARDTIGQNYDRKTVATQECRLSDALYAPGDSYTIKSATAIEGIATDAFYTSVGWYNTVITSYNEHFIGSMNEAVAFAVIYGIVRVYGYARKHAAA